MKKQSLLVLYDGHCLLCNRFIRGIIANDTNDKLRAAALQTYAQLDHKIPIDEHVDSVVLLVNDTIHYKSEAVLMLKAELSSFPWLYNLLRIVPKFVRDAVYDLIAKNRNKWFGRADECIMPSPEERKKYLVSIEELESYLKNLN